MANGTTELLRYADDVWRTVNRLVGDQDDALDCYQQTFLDALKLSDSDVVDWKSMLCRIAIRRCMDCLRHRYRDRSVPDFTEDLLCDPKRPAESMEFEELRESVRQVLSTLPEQQAEAFYLRHIELWQPAEIAVQMRLDPAHVRVLIHRALQALRHRLPQSLKTFT
ncbi:RNA polymerase sigma factor [Rhodopirellula sp. MGV]|uniref:RNA polymerase sigma factor n=1 Tax=Rhodopirellula sp. MGV TaxID=2023130 RepID=UPI000BD140F3|nr:sigma-70 family RNA polymerase sigma factor [Rhodopirellula sp. MGV]OYP36003.1 hypothetical protein CGZ80_09615 [Rhodopirellula sp. MGV]